MRSALRVVGDRPSIPHHGLKLHVPAKAKKPKEPRPEYNSAAEWPAWTDEEVLTAYVDPTEWPDHVARARFTVPEAIDLYFATEQLPIDGPQEQGGD